MVVPEERAQRVKDLKALYDRVRPGWIPRFTIGGSLRETFLSRLHAIFMHMPSPSLHGICAPAPACR